MEQTLATSLSIGHRSEHARPSLVTVGIPTFNRVELLQRAVAAVQAQTYRPLKLVICDNASTDHTESFARDLAEVDPAVLYIRHAMNLGPTANFESARDAATGDYFMWLADDDWLSPDYVAQCVAVLESEPGVALAAGVPTYYKDGTWQLDGVPMNVLGDSPTERVLEFYGQVIDNGTFYGLYPLPILRAATPFRQRMGADWLFTAEIAALGEIRTVPSAEIRRDMVGDYSFERIAEVGGLSRFEGRHPHFSIAVSAGWEVAFGSTIHRGLGPQRFALAARSSVVLIQRFVLTGPRWSRLRGRARAAKARARRHIANVLRPKRRSQKNADGAH